MLRATFFNDDPTQKYERIFWSSIKVSRLGRFWTCGDSLLVWFQLDQHSLFLSSIHLFRYNGRRRKSRSSGMGNFCVEQTSVLMQAAFHPVIVTQLLRSTSLTRDLSLIFDVASPSTVCRRVSFYFWAFTGFQESSRCVFDHAHHFFVFRFFLASFWQQQFLGGAWRLFIFPFVAILFF